MRILSLFLVLCFCPIGEAMQRVSSIQETPQVPYSIGVQTIESSDLKRNRPIIIEVWYPTSYIDDLEPQRGAPFIHSHPKMPLIVMSHGHRGSRLNHAWLAIELARQGYCVASVEHYGNSKENFNPLLSLKFWDRFKDVSFTIDEILNRFGSQIDAKRIGFIGYSMGGMTGLGLAGAQARNIKEVVLREYRNVKGFTEEMIAQVDFSEGERLFRDSRIQAMLLLCPANFVYPPASLKKIQIPVGLVATFHDEILPHQDHAYPIICHIVPRKIKVIREKISHSFFSPGPEASHDGGKLHQEVADFASDFFRTCLK